jgi:hypothetical protein
VGLSCVFDRGLIMSEFIMSGVSTGRQVYNRAVAGKA